MQLASSITPPTTGCWDKGLCAILGRPLDSASLVTGALISTLVPIAAACLASWLYILRYCPRDRLRHLTHLAVLGAVIAIWKIAAPEPTLPPPLGPQSFNRSTRCVRTCELVVAHCHENLDWVIRDAKFYRHVYIYTKCGASPGPNMTSLANVEVIKSPNIGSNDYAILQHIVRRYDKLSPLTVFCEAGMNWLCHPDTVMRPHGIGEKRGYRYACASWHASFEPASAYHARQSNTTFMTSRTCILRRITYAQMNHSCNLRCSVPT